MNRLKISDSEIESIKKNISQFSNKTGLKFLSQHLGMKNKKMHLFLGTPGGGKSTLRNSLIMDFLFNNPDKIVCLHLSEESIDDFKVDLVSNPSMMKYLDRIRVTSEQDDPIDKPMEEFDDFIESIIKSNAGLFVFDNITTSDFYGETPREQAASSKKIKQALEFLNCPVVLFAHTDSTVKTFNRRMIDQNEIRGSKKIVNLAEFLYILQTFEQNDIVYTTLRIVKHRATAAENKIFRLYFNKETRIYDKDIKLDTDAYFSFFKHQVS